MDRFIKTRDIVLDFIDENDSFTYDQLVNKVEKEGGFLRVSPCCTIDEYLQRYEKSGILTFENDYFKKINIENRNIGEIHNC